MNNIPKCGEIYTLHQIYRELQLRDSPYLGVDVKGLESPIQTSHLSEDELLSVPGFKDTKWKYLRETHEWIPVFVYYDSTPAENYVDSSEYIDPFTDKPSNFQYWVTPKGFPREQYRS